MRAKKLLRVTAIVVGSLAVTLLFLVAFFLFNPFEGSLPEMRDVVPRNVDFYTHKTALAADFGDPDAFPYVRALVELGRSPAWEELKKGAWFRGLGIGAPLEEIRKDFVDAKAQLPLVHPIADLIGREVQVAGRLGPTGLLDSRWCLYTRVTWRGKAAYGALAQGYVREELRKQGLAIGDDGPFYTIQGKGMREPLFAARYLDCVMLSNDRPLIADSLTLAEGGGVGEVEALGPSGHYKDGVEAPLEAWAKRTGVRRPNVLELHVSADKLLPKLPALRNWPDPGSQDNRNERIIASFLNPSSWRFLSGSLIFEINSLSLLSHLVVNNNKHTDFQKDLFTAEATPRSEWMDQFFQMVPLSACGAAALRLSAGSFVREMMNDALSKDERDVLEEAIRRTGKYKGIEDLISQVESSLLPRVGVILRPNRRSTKTVETFKVHFPSPYPQWSFVFWMRKGARTGVIRNQALKDLINLVNGHRNAFFIDTAFSLDLTGTGGQADVAFEFAIPQVPGTGCVAACTYGEYFMCGSSGPFIHEIVSSLNGVAPSRRRDRGSDFQEFVDEMPDAVNGVAFAWADKILEVVEDFRNFAGGSQEFVDAAFASRTLPQAEKWVFENQGWAQKHTSIAQLRNSADNAAFNAAADVRLRQLWDEHQRQQLGASTENLLQLTHLCGTFRSAYLQMLLDSSTLQIWGRVLAPQYGR